MRSALRRFVGLGRWPPGGIVLLYHRVATLETDPHRLAVTPAHFAEHLEVINELGVPMSVESMVERAPRGEVPPGAVAMTFDDGYADNLHCAAPLLARARVPATIFISTGASESGGEFWWDERDRGRTPGATPLDPRPTHLPLGRDEIAVLAQQEGITIGSHTHSHPSLSSLPVDAQRREIATARRLLESSVGSPVTSFAYPFGGSRDVSDCTRQIVRDEGITIACTTRPDSVREDVDPLRVPRLVVRDWSKAEFLERWRSWTR
ncbi:MAG: polysaccharide deacetylase family protein [Vicinamibacterales bacterium]